MTTRGRRARRRRRIIAVLLAIVVVTAASVLGVVGWYRSQLSGGGGSRTMVEVLISSGSSTSDIAKTLEGAGVIRNATAFTWHVRLGDTGPFEAGRYRFLRDSSADEAIGVLSKGPLGPVITKVSIPEGFRLGQIRQRIHDSVPRLSLADVDAALSGGRVQSPLLPPGGKNWEGLLFPATYSVTPTESAEDLLQQMADAMTKRVNALTLDPSVTALGLSDYQVVIVASLVQAEAGNPDEAPKIARVIYNRLAAHQPLGIDATSRYLSILTGADVDFESASPYNTRRNTGLPPTPIGAPGEFALEAAAHPAPGDWIYYVRAVENDAQGRPQHVFTSSASEFEKAKKACHDAGLGCGAS